MSTDLLQSLAQLAAQNPALPVLFALVIFLSPLVLLRLFNSFPDPRMVLESLGLGALFGWNSHWRASSDGHADSSSEKRKLKKKMRHGGRSRDEGSSRSGGSGDTYPGLVNVSGTYCFMNSTLQALSSLSYLQPHLDDLHSRAEDLDMPTPVIDAVRDTLNELNTPHHSRRSFRPMAVIDVLSNPAPGQRQSMLFNSMQHQDAQELFQLVSECMKNESAALDKEAADRLRGLAGVLFDEAAARSHATAPSGVFDGLTANRRSCVDCGYTEAVMHFGFDNWTLPVPRASQCRLEECLADYTRIEVLTDCICRRCSMVATHARLQREVEKLSSSIEGSKTGSEEKASLTKKKRLRETRKLEQAAKLALDEGRVEDDIRGLKMERVFASASTKQAMVARPPAVLAIHLNRSMHFGYGGAGKNSCVVLYPEFLDLTPFTTSGQLSTKPQHPISAHANGRSTTPTPANAGAPRVLYRLQAIVCHYGSHSYGHYVAFRRKPSQGYPRPPRLPPPTALAATAVASAPWMNPSPSSSVTADADDRWLRISDSNVEDVPLAHVLSETQSTFMLYYERIPQQRPPLPPADSEETLRPPRAVNASTDTLTPVSEDDAAHEEQRTGTPQRARSVARVFHAYDRGRMSRSPSIFGTQGDGDRRARSEESLVNSVSSLHMGSSTSSLPAESSSSLPSLSVAPSAHRAKSVASEAPSSIAGLSAVSSSAASPSAASSDAHSTNDDDATESVAESLGSIGAYSESWISVPPPRATSPALSSTTVTSTGSTSTHSSSTATPSGTKPSTKRKGKLKRGGTPSPQVVGLRA